MITPELRALLEEHHRESHGWALACCDGDAETAENVLQTAYLAVLEGRATFEGCASFKTWLFAVIRNHARREWRRRFWQLRRRVSWEAALDLAGREPALDEATYGREMQTLLRQALARLARRQREILQLVFYHEFSLAEAAGVLGIAVGSARRHYDRGKKKLRKLLEEATGNHALGRREDLATVPGRETRG